jgi:hypothetical protein
MSDFEGSGKIAEEGSNAGSSAGTTPNNDLLKDDNSFNPPNNRTIIITGALAARAGFLEKHRRVIIVPQLNDDALEMVTYFAPTTSAP